MARPTEADILGANRRMVVGRYLSSIRLETKPCFTVSREKLRIMVKILSED